MQMNAANEFLTLLFGNRFTTSVSAATFTFASFYLINNLIDEDKRQIVADHLLGKRQITGWHGEIAHLSDRVFGARIVSVRGFLASSIASTAVVITIFILQLQFAGKEFPDFEADEITSYLTFLIVVCNLTIDFLSVVKTRLLIRRFAGRASTVSLTVLATVLVVDTLASAGLFVFGVILAANLAELIVVSLIFFGLAVILERATRLLGGSFRAFARRLLAILFFAVFTCIAVVLVHDVWIIVTGWEQVVAYVILFDFFTRFEPDGILFAGLCSTIATSAWLWVYGLSILLVRVARRFGLFSNEWVSKKVIAEHPITFLGGVGAILVFTASAVVEKFFTPWYLSS